MNKDLNNLKNPVIKIDKSLDEKYKGKVLFPKKLEEANRTLKRVGVPNPDAVKKYSQTHSKK